MSADGDFSNPPGAPRWLRDVLRFLPLRSQFVLWGNIRDRQAWVRETGVVPLPLPEFLAAHLAAAGVPHVLAFAIGEGLRVVPAPGGDPQETRDFCRERFQLDWPDGADVLPLDCARFFELLPRFADSRAGPLAVVVDPASRLLVRPDAPGEAEHAHFTRALLSSLRARPLAAAGGAGPVFNTILWLADREGDLPDWLVLENPRLRAVPVTLPDAQTRRALAAAACRGLPGFAELAEADAAALLGDFADQTHGLRLDDVLGIVQLCRIEGLAFAELPEGARRYKLGVTEDPWRKIDRAKIRRADATIRQRVMGQDRAVTAMLDIVKRAVIGLSGTGKRSQRPRGVAFLAGPTGTGKTELAKTVTRLLFGDEQAYIRFDMSEFAAEHADQRLLGAPPGYIGYDSGGELTNAIRERPFSVVLFDEIEKAHPRILDKFLQILDDGVLTSGRGERVYFSEAFVIFTSNLGIYRTLPGGVREAVVDASEDYESVVRKVRGGIEDYFKLELGRPEILNRLGENILVFDFIRPPVARDIFAGMLDRILADLREETGIAIRMEDAARKDLETACLADLSNGGRGIRNQLEARLINPLSRALFDAGHESGARVAVTAVAAAPELPEVRLRVESA